VSRTRAWPIPHDRPVDRARTITLGLLQALERADTLDAARDEVAAIVSQARAWGETWLTSAQVDGPWLTAQQVADLAGVGVGAVYMWTSRNRLTRHPQGYAEREVLDFLAARRGPHTPPEER
jgi:hypothetical protein